MCHVSKEYASCSSRKRFYDNMPAKEIDWKIKKEHLIMKCERSLNEKKSKSAKDREKGVADIWSMIAFFINPMHYFSIIYLENGHIIFAKRR